ncbi:MULTISPECIES: MFS transporter [Rhodococcus]|jgi:ACS family tartrate transporter-like MFS transporter|uniref:MFS transporter n=1 Tax=Rhodococcus TaxID=1827 RepID=UPI001788FF87|nr:MFS transporter [Rhodococcus sp. APC 3903]MDN3460118.1 MFS transporter [Rhodococcus sp. APC 3903]
MTDGKVPHHLDAQDERRMWRKISFRIMPLIGLAFVVSYIDRANLGYIAKPLSADLGLTSAALGLAGSLFFIGYILMEVPSNMMLERFGARIWISRIVISWGLVTIVTAAVHSTTQLFIARILLGIAEAGLSAGIILYLTFWFPKKQRAWAMSTFFLMIPISNIVGAPIAAALLKWGEGLMGISGWRSLFVVEGALTVLVGIVILAFLPSRPKDAKWLAPEERAFIAQTLEAEHREHSAHGALTGMRQALTSGRIWALAVAFFAVVFGIYPLAFFLPTMIDTLNKTIGSSANVSGVLLAAIPYVVALVAMIVWGRVGTRRSAVFSTTVPMAIGVIGLVSATFTQNGALFIVAVCVSVSGIYSAFAQFWRIPAIALSGAAAAAGIALINSVSNTSGLVGPYLTGFIKDRTGGYTYALLLIAAVMVAGIVILLTVGRKAEQIGDHTSGDPSLTVAERT